MWYNNGIKVKKRLAMLKRTQKYKAVIFDKDGTLLDFEALWLSISEAALTEILEKLGKSPTLLADILAAYGVEDGIARIDGILCYGTYDDMSEAAYRILAQDGISLSREEFHGLLVEVYHRHMASGNILPICPALPETLLAFRRAGHRLFVVTSDDENGAEKCLVALGIRGLFEKVYAHTEGRPHKPSAELFRLICEENGLSPDEIVMVGDSLVDIQFGKNGGATAVGVGKSPVNRALLEAAGADFVLPDVSFLGKVLR